ncbi:MAG TPA: L-threonylcarbamoyladenylate synthase [Candidatus Paceibacterota bacterium]|nr:L-threonylcarbamoyladenylate synthase [Candidatus Paceibacterota bacterium]
MKVVEIIKILRNGGIGVIPTDTIYGLVGSALSRRAVERIYRLRKRDRRKPFIVLIGSLADLGKFGVKVNERHLKLLKTLWPVRQVQGKPGPVSVILPCPNRKFFYLHRGTKSIAFRLPNDRKLTSLIRNTGPLVAPSANFSGKPPAKTVVEAKRYFGNKVDFYLDGGRLAGAPSTLVEVKR